MSAISSYNRLCVAKGYALNGPEMSQMSGSPLKRCVRRFSDKKGMTSHPEGFPKMSRLLTRGFVCFGGHFCQGGWRCPSGGKGIRVFAGHPSPLDDDRTFFCHSSHGWEIIRHLHQFTQSRESPILTAMHFQLHYLIVDYGKLQ